MSFELSVTLLVPGNDLAGAVVAVQSALPGVTVTAIHAYNQNQNQQPTSQAAAEVAYSAAVAAPVAAPAEAPAEVPAEVPAEEKPKRTRKAKSDPAPVEEATAPAPAATAAAAPVEEAVAYTIDDVKSVTTQVAARLGRDAAVGLLNQFGAAKATLVDPAKFGAYVAAANELLGA